MSQTTVGKLLEILVLETEQDGEPVVVAYPKGSIVEVSSEDGYPHTVSTDNIEEAVKYLKDKE